jgi:squalene-hopene/tetraprenyl-beta-curcumene cyclase
MQIRRMIAVTLVAALTAGLFAAPALALDDAHAAKAEAAIKKGLDWLRKAQGEDGSWSPKYGPAITGLTLSAFARQPGMDRNDPTIAKAIDFILKFVREDGAISGPILGNYNTSLSLMGLAPFSDDAKIAGIIKRAQQYAMGQQWKTGMKDPDGKEITPDHPFYGGAGYGKHGRPDMNNTTIMVQALYDSGVDCNDPAFKRAMVYISRCQGIASNDMFGEDIEPGGGFIYATSINKENIGTPETKANHTVIVDGKEKLGTYGSITYAAFKSMLFAQADPADPRIKAVWEWISHNYTLEQNPRMPEEQKFQSYFYYLHVFARAMHATGQAKVKLADGTARDWANDVISQLVELQSEDGSFVNKRADRWGEGDAHLVTAYSVIALQNALGRR